MTGSGSSIQPLRPHPGAPAGLAAGSLHSSHFASLNNRENTWHRAAQSSKDRVLADTHWLTSGTISEFPGQVRDQEWLLAQLGGKSLSQGACWESCLQQASRTTLTENQNNSLASPGSPMCLPTPLASHLAAPRASCLRAEHRKDFCHQSLLGP